jgi:RNA polymerase sigma-70 factor (ECF subfamily)
MLGRREIAQEVVQDVFIRLWRSGPKFNSEKAAYAWIFKACHNASIDVLRSALYRHEANADDVLEAPDLVSPDSPLRSAENRQLLRHAIASLSAQEAAVVMYYAFDSMNQEEIAAQMQLSRKTIGRIISRYQTRLGMNKEGDRA